eukprot:7351216-Prymnesium_polylepis.1
MSCDACHNRHRMSKCGQCLMRIAAADCPPKLDPTTAVQNPELSACGEPIAIGDLCEAEPVTRFASGRGHCGTRYDTDNCGPDD